MAKCVICGNDSGRGKTCGSTCRKKLQRQLSVTGSVTQPNCDKQSVTVLPDGMFSETISWDVIHNLPPGVSRPTVRPSDIEGNGDGWWNYPEYAQTIDRLLTHDSYELEDAGVFVPSWAFQYHGLPLYRTAEQGAVK